MTPWLIAASSLRVLAALADSDHTGKVTLTGVSIPGATVTAKQGEKTVSTITDQGGVYRFTGLADGAWTMTVTMVGFDTITRDVTLPSSAEGVWELTLLPIEKIVGTLPAPRPDSQLQTSSDINGLAHRAAGQKPATNARGHSANRLSARRRQSGRDYPATGSGRRRCPRRSDGHRLPRQVC